MIYLFGHTHICKKYVTANKLTSNQYKVISSKLTLKGLEFSEEDFFILISDRDDEILEAFDEIPTRLRNK